MALTQVDISSYNTFRADTIGRGFDVDNAYGFQCWDLGATLWGNTGDYVYPYLQTGSLGYASEIWTSSRVINAGNDFTLIYNLADVKRGDMVVLGASAISSTGHNAFADEDYQPSHPSYLSLLGQNQVNPNFTTGHVATVNNIDVTAFLGAFRFKRWTVTPPTPSKRKVSHFPWFLVAEKLRNQRRA